MSQSKKSLELLGIFLSMILLGWMIFNSYPMQSFIGSWASGLDPQRRQHAMVKMKEKSDRDLLKLIYHGDTNIAGAAGKELELRNQPEYFSVYLKLLKSSHEQTRAIGRDLIWVEPDKAPQVLLDDIKRFEPSDTDYQLIIRTLASKKNKLVYPYIAEYANQPDGWKNGSAHYFEELGDPEALEILYELKKRAPDEKSDLGVVDKLSLRDLNKAIGALEVIKAQQESSGNSTNT